MPTETLRAAPTEYYRKLPAIVEGALLTIENGEAIAEWCGGHWLPDGIRPEFRRPHESGGALKHPQLWMPKWGTGLPVAYARRTGPDGEEIYEGDHIIRGVMGEFYVSRPETFERAYEPCTGDMANALPDPEMMLADLRKMAQALPGGMAAWQEKFRALDAWLTAGGAPPKDWRRRS